MVCSTNKTDRHDITEILLKVALNTLTLTLSAEQKEINKLPYFHFAFLVCIVPTR